MRTSQFFCILMLAFVAVSAYAETYVSGEQWGTWELSGSPYVLNGDVIIPDGNVLTIEPGVEIQLNNSNYEMEVDGILDASGVDFTGSRYVFVTDGGSADLCDCSFTTMVLYYAGSSGTVNNCTGSWDLWIYDSAVTLAGSCEFDELFLNAPVLTVSNHTINTLHIDFEGSSTISNNTIGSIVLQKLSGATTITANRIMSQPFLITDPDADTSGISGNTYEAADPYIRIGGTFDSDHTMGLIDGLGKYCIDAGDFTVGTSAAVTIVSGVEIQLNNSNYEMEVDGILDASGVDFTGSRYVFVTDGGSADLCDCSFTTMVLYYAGSRGTIQCSLMTNLFIDAAADVLVAYNDFSSGTVAVSGDPCSTINLECNWWGTTDPAVIETKLTHHTDNPGLPCADYEPFLLEPPTGLEPEGENVIYLDFTSYTPPFGYGTVQEIASFVKNYVSGRFVMDRVVFETTFDGPIERPDLTSIVYFGDSVTDPNILGLATTDPGNQNWTDIAFVYTDQSLFSTLPLDAVEYKNMLANGAAHEIGHLLGYGHGDAAGMPFMNNGINMKSSISQDLLLRKLGEISQEEWTYVKNLGFIPESSKPAIVLAQKLAIGAEDFNAVVQNLADRYPYEEDLAVIQNFGKTAVMFSLDLADLYYGLGLSGAIGLTCDFEDAYNSMVEETLRVEFCENNSSSALDLGDSNDLVLESVWDVDRQMYISHFDSNILHDANNLRMTISYITDNNDSNRIDVFIFDSHLLDHVTDHNYIDFSNIDPNGDINVDGTTNLKDFAVLASYYTRPCTYLDRAEGADLNRDEFVDNQDLFILAENWLWQKQE